jgi:hypothetical protein
MAPSKSASAFAGSTREISPEEGVQGLGVVQEHLLQAQPEAGQEPGQLDTLSVQDLDPLVAVAVLGLDGLHLDDVADGCAVGVLGAEVALERTGDADGVVGRVRNDGDELAVHDQGPAPFDVSPADQVPELALQVPGQRILGLVVVLVGVVDLEVDVHVGGLGIDHCPHLPRISPRR